MFDAVGHNFFVLKKQRGAYGRNAVGTTEGSLGPPVAGDPEALGRSYHVSQTNFITLRSECLNSHGEAEDAMHDASASRNQKINEVRRPRPVFHLVNSN